jgi:tartrate-resistant acid phosphatase type 5
MWVSYRWGVVGLCLILCSCEFQKKFRYTGSRDRQKQTSRSLFLMPKNQEKYSFLAFGDSGTGKGYNTDPQMRVARAMTQVCKERGCDFAIGLGDNFYPHGVRSKSAFEKKFEIPYQNLDIPFFMTLGNRDYEGDVESQVKYQSERWSLPNKFYKVKNLPSWLNLFAMNTNRLGNRQIKAISDGLCKASGWRLLYGHHPLFSNGSHGDNKDLKDRLLPVIKKCKIQAYFSGHDHNFESITTPTFEQIISGSAGDTGHVKQKQRSRLTQNFASAELGFTRVEATPDSLTYTFYNENAEAIFSKTLQNSSN